MPIPERVRHPAADAAYHIQITDDGSPTLIRTFDGVSFHSGCGAIAECDHVYIRNAGMNGPAAHWPQDILEIGFGSGLAMLRTLIRHQTAQHPPPLHYLAVESDPLSIELWRCLALADSLGDPDLAHRFDSWWSSVQPAMVTAKSRGTICSSTWKPSDRVDVTVLQADARTWLDQTDQRFDAIYFDPFDPATNPDLWCESVYRCLRKCLRPGGRLVTYCVKSQVQRQMRNVGFHVRCVPGPPGGKREVMIAHRQ